MSILHDLAQIPVGITKPTYHPSQHGVGIVHIGLRALMRAHLTVFTTDALAAAGEDSLAQDGAWLNAVEDQLYAILSQGMASTIVRFAAMHRQLVLPRRSIGHEIFCVTLQILDEIDHLALPIEGNRGTVMIDDNPIAAFEGEQRLYQVIARHIRRLIEDNRTNPDWRVPAERDLAEMFSVSRPVIREAIIALEVSGVVRVKGRAGIMILPVSQTSAQTTFESADVPISIQGLLETRFSLETNVAFLVAGRRSASLGALEDHLAAMIRPMSPDDFCQLASQFQVSMAEATSNPMLVAIVGKLHEAWLASPDLVAAKETLFGDSARPQWIGDHHAIFASIRSGQADAAYKAASRHIGSLRLEVSSSEPLSAGTRSQIA